MAGMGTGRHLETGKCTSAARILQYVTFDHSLYTGADPKSFGGENVILNLVDVNYVNAKTFRPRNGVNKPFDNVSCWGVFKIFFREGHQFLSLFQA